MITLVDLAIDIVSQSNEVVVVAISFLEIKGFAMKSYEVHPMAHCRTMVSVFVFRGRRSSVVGILRE